MEEVDNGTTGKTEFYEMARTLKETEREVTSMQFPTTQIDRWVGRWTDGWTDGATSPPQSVIPRLL